VSPLWRDEVGLYVSPRRIVLTRMKRGLRPVNVAERNFPVANAETNQWQPALDALESCLDENTWHDAAGRLILADHWARYCIVPWSDALTDQDERLQHARYCLAKTYGDVVSQWTVTLNEAAPGLPQVACAIPSALLGRMHELTEMRNLRVKSVQPQLIAAFNGWRGKLPVGDGWFVTLEEGSLAAAHFNATGWDGVHSVRIGDDWEIELKRLQTFGRLARSSPVDGTVYVDAPRWLRNKASGSKNDVEWLDDEPAEGGSAPDRFALLQRLYA
jgi:hypothetical protein